MITTGSDNQRPNTLCIKMWIDVTFQVLENSLIIVKLLLSIWKQHALDFIIVLWKVYLWKNMENTKMYKYYSQFKKSIKFPWYHCYKI